MKNKRLNAYLKYSGLAFQMMATLVVFAFIGRKLDAWMGLEKPLITAVFLIIGFVAAIYPVFRDLLKK